MDSNQLPNALSLLKGQSDPIADLIKEKQGQELTNFLNDSGYYNHPDKFLTHFSPEPSPNVENRLFEDPTKDAVRNAAMKMYTPVLSTWYNDRVQTAPAQTTDPMAIDAGYNKINSWAPTPKTKTKGK